MITSLTLQFEVSCSRHVLNPLFISRINFRPRHPGVGAHTSAKRSGISDVPGNPTGSHAKKPSGNCVLLKVTVINFFQPTGLPTLRL